MSEQLTESTVTLETGDGPMDAFQVVPAGEGPHPALLVAMEAFGVNSHIQEVCRRFAREGYVALAPDFYHRTGRMLTYAYDDPKRREPFSALTNAGIERDIQSALAHLGGLPQADTGRIGAIGFCVGGFMAFLAACRTDVATAVCFYGGGIVNLREGLALEPLLNETERIKVPILCIFGDQDASIPMAEVDAIRGRLDMQSRAHEVIVYPGAGHGFFCDERSSFKSDAADGAWKRTRKWLEVRLKGLQPFPTED
jgi:carboxymethylenebutenolidase